MMQSIILIALGLAFVKFIVWYDDKETKREEFLIQRIKDEEEREKEREEFIKQLYLDMI